MGFSRPLSGTGDHNDDRIATRPSALIHDLLNDGRQIWGLVRLADRVPWRHTVPWDGSGGRRSAGDIIDCVRERRWVKGQLSPEDQIRRTTIRLVRREFNVGPRYGGSRWDRDILKAHAYFLIVSSFRYELQIAASKIYRSCT